MKNYWSNWNIMRVARLILGIFIIAQGIQTREWMFVVFGGIFSIMPIFNVGCCGGASCNTPLSKSNKEVEDISYEEIK